MLAYRSCFLLACLQRVCPAVLAGMKRTAMMGPGGSEGVTEPKRVKDQGGSVSVAEQESFSEVASDCQFGLAARGGKRKEKREKQFDWSL